MGFLRTYTKKELGLQNDNKELLLFRHQQKTTPIHSKNHITTVKKDYGTSVDNAKLFNE
jgi:hypothetical protein